jgi:hypothetical protein
MAKKLNKPTITTLNAVREAVKTLGVESPLAKVRNWVKDQYNLAMTDATAQKYFYDARKELREQTATPPPAKAPRKQAMPAAARSTGGNGTGLGVDQVVEAVTVLKGLVQNLGKDNVAKLLGAL